MAVPARVVANEFIRLARADGRALTPLQIIKLVYIAHGWMLALYQRPLISDEVEAWKYGPAIPSLYHALKKYGSGAVTGTIGGSFFESSDLDDDEKDVIEQVYGEYGHLNGIQLSRITHSPGTPWHETWTGQPNELIPNDLIAEHYRQLRDEQQDAAERG